VTTPGPMHGRFFYSCGNWTPTCRFFVWAAWLPELKPQPQLVLVNRNLRWYDGGTGTTGFATAIAACLSEAVWWR
jgi:hypothetical protein